MSLLYPDLSFSTFPNTIDIINLMQNMSGADYIKVNSYQNYIKNGDYVNAQITFNTITNGNLKIFSAQKYNQLRDSVLSMERFYKTDIIPYVSGLQSDWLNTINLFRYIGVYSPIVKYYKNNMISFTINSGIINVYIAIKDVPTGTSPSNTVYWRVITAQGVQGVSGVGMSWLGDWDSSTTYTVQDAVVYGNIIWGCIQTNFNQVPFVGSLYWQNLMSIAPTQYPVQETAPSSPATGDLWFEVIA